MLAAFLIGIILLIFGIVSENAKTRKQQNRKRRKSWQKKYKTEADGSVHIKT